MVKLKNGLLFVFMAIVQMQLSAMTTQGDRILNSSGKEIQLKGVSWFGFNNHATMVDGLKTSSTLASDFATVVYRLQLLGFNAIRLPFSFKDIYDLPPQNLTKNCQIPSITAIQASVTNPSVSVQGKTIPPMVYAPNRVPGKCNDYFPNNSTLDRFLWTVSFFAKNGFYVLIDNHAREDQTFLENRELWVQLWTDLVTKISQDPLSKSMLMIDILNEPDQFNVRWEAANGLPGLKDLYVSIMEAVYPINNEALFFIEGTGQGDIGANWGDGFATDPHLIAEYNLSNPRSFFDTLFTKPYLNQVVISPHVYPPSVTHANSDYSGSGLYTRLSESFGYLTQSGYCNDSCKTFPVAIGEFGSRFIESDDLVSMQDIAKYLNNSQDALDGKHRSIPNWFYWSWNPNSSDTGGLVADNWQDVEWKKIDYLATIGLVPWYLKANPVKTGTLCISIAPASGLSASDLKPITVGSKSYHFNGFNQALCNALPLGSYTVTAPQLTTKEYQFTANPQTITINEGKSTLVQVVYTGTPIVQPTGNFVVTVEIGTAWQEDPSSGIYMNGINLYVTNNSSKTINVPWKITISNPDYKAVSSYWNMTVDSTQNGEINATIKESWEVLFPNGANTVNIGMIVSSTSPNFKPASISINGKPVSITVK